MSPSSRIRVLPDIVANKIAAGEVVDRPASLVKELVENAIDAGARRIDVALAAGGRKLVAVSDDGSGMGRDDVLLSIERHATSKISDVEDIERVGSLGFRGEALAAIASVSRLRIGSRTAEDEVGTELTAIGGKLTQVSEIGRPPGTSIEVKDLFFNVPARRKFLRSHTTELAHAKSAFVIQALARPEVGMSLTVDGSEVHVLPQGASLEERIAELFGNDYMARMRRVDYKSVEVSVSGYVSIPPMSRSDRSEWYIFVNGRCASSPLISHALGEGYRSLLPGNRYASVFLFISTDPGLVDVNVHPAKREVRFRHPVEVRDAVIDAVQGALAPDGDKRLGVSGEAAAPPELHQRVGVPELRIQDLPGAAAFRYPRLPMQVAAPGSAERQGQAASGADAEASRQAVTAGETGSPWSWCRVVGQIGGLYVVLETEDGYALMDPHAAHERVLFEKYMAEVVNSQVVNQGLLAPETLEFRPKDAARLREHLDTLNRMGFRLAEFGGDSFVVDAVPACLGDVSAASVVSEIVQGIEAAGLRGGRGRWVEESIAGAACKSAVKARDKLTLQEIERLVTDLAGAEMPYTCPHGRPTLIYTSFGDLDRKFGRI